jgi:hypothetical protein
MIRTAGVSPCTYFCVCFQFEYFGHISLRRKAKEIHRKPHALVSGLSNDVDSNFDCLNVVRGTGRICQRGKSPGQDPNRGHTEIKCSIQTLAKSGTLRIRTLPRSTRCRRGSRIPSVNLPLPALLLSLPPSRISNVYSEQLVLLFGLCCFSCIKTHIVTWGSGGGCSKHTNAPGQVTIGQPPTPRTSPSM